MKNECFKLNLQFQLNLIEPFKNQEADLKYIYYFFSLKKQKICETPAGKA